MIMDIFEAYLAHHKAHREDTVALVCASYKPVYQRLHGEALIDDRVNTELATYGDALLRFALVSLFLDKVEKLSEHIKQYLTDKFLIECVAEHYRLLDYILYDEDNPLIPAQYVFYKNDRTKYIATSVEAVLGDIYREGASMEDIRALVESWTHL
jgi:dsRNA-specific ribonuclease